MDNWRRFRATVGGSSGTSGLATPAAKDQQPAVTADGSPADGDKAKDNVLSDDLLWGLENFGNTCYCNSILQALYATEPFRHFVEAYPDVKQPYNALGGPVATEPIRTATPDSAAAASGAGPGAGADAAAASPVSPTPKEKGRISFGFGKKSQQQSAADAQSKGGAAPGQTAAAAQPPAAAGPPPVVLPPDPDFPDMTLFSTVQTLFHHLSTSHPHHPAAPKTPQAANGQTNATGSNAASLPSASLVANANATAANGQPQGPALLASLPPPSTPRGGGPYLAGTLGRGVVRPEDVLRTVRRHHALFAGQGQQDAHEFLGFILNQLAEEVERLDSELKARGEDVTTIGGCGKTFIHNLFQGVLVNETRCLNCETTSSREESFLDLSIDIEQHSSLTACLRQFSHSEMLCSTNKFYCETCCSLVEAERRMRIKSLPNILGLHLKRFRQDEMGRLHKLFYRVTFPLQLRVPCTTEDTNDAERLYELFAVVVHIGNGPTHGHYVTVIRAGSQWVMCDDENVEPIEEADLANYFGDNITGAGYVLFYQAVNLDLKSLGLKNLPAPREPRPLKAAPADTVVHDKAKTVDPEVVSVASTPSVSVTAPEVPQPAPPPVVPVAVTPTKPSPAIVTSALTATRTGSSNPSSRVATPDSSLQREPAASSTLSPAAASSTLSPAAASPPSSFHQREPSTHGTTGTTSSASTGLLRRDQSNSHRDPVPPTAREQSATRSPQEKSKWYSLKKRESVNLGSLTSSPEPRRRESATTISTSMSMSGLLSPQSDAPQALTHATGQATPARVSHSPVRAGTGDNGQLAGVPDLSASMMSTSTTNTNSSNQSSSLAVPFPQGPGGGGSGHGSRSVSMSRPDGSSSQGARPDRTASGTQLNGSGQNYTSGTSLGRKISGAASFGKFKMGFGRKHAKVDE